MRTLEQLTEEILSLPSESRVLLVEKLIESLECDIDPVIQSAWLAESKQRQRSIQSGAAQPIISEEVFSHVGQLLEN
jgi:hypothetical protein